MSVAFTKENDLEAFALCALTPTRGKPDPGCHFKFDNYQLGDAAWTQKQAKKWGAVTRVALEMSGQLPPKLEAAVKAYTPPRTRK